MSDNDSTDWVPPHLVDPWIRFDMWAEQAHTNIQAAITIQNATDSDTDQPSPRAQVYMWAADCYAVLASASAAEADPPTTAVNITPVTSEADNPD